MAKNKTTFQPYGQWILLPNPAKKVTDSGILLDDKTAEARVLHLDEGEFILIAEYQILGKFA